MRRDKLFAVTLAYLLVPNVIFALGWLRPAFAFPIVIVAALCLFDAGRRAVTASPVLSWRAWGFVLAFAAFWTYTAGIGELNAQTTDYFKHNLVFHDLITMNWPVVYHGAGLHDPILCYYIAYYLPTSLLAKLFGLQYAATFSLAWGFAGLVLAFAWVCRLGRPHGPLVLILFTLIDSFCWLPGLYTLGQKVGPLVGRPGSDLWRLQGLTTTFWEFGASHIRLHLHCESAMLLWSPQVALGAWLTTACVLSSLIEKRPPRHVLLLNAVVLLWSPLVGLGLIPFTVAAWLRQPRQGFSWPNLLGTAAFGIPPALYFMAHRPQQFAGVFVGLFSGVADWLRYLLFLVLVVGVFWGAVQFLRRRCRVPDQPQWKLLCLAALALMATTAVYMGRFNDWLTQVGLPSLFVFQIMLAMTAVQLWTHRPLRAYRLAFLLLLLASAERSLRVYALAPFGKLEGQGKTTTIVTARTYAPSLARLPGTAKWDFASQYLGSTESVFGRWFMK